MKKKGFSAKLVIEKLREAEVLLSQGSTVGEVSRKLGITEQTYYRWRREYGGDAARSGQKAQGVGEGEREAQEAGGRSDFGQCDSQGGGPKLLSPSRRRKVVRWVCESLRISQRRACRVLGQARSTQRHRVGVSGEEERLVTQIIALATRYGRYGYRRVTALLRAEGWRVNHKRVEQIWRQEGLKVPKKQPKRGRLWLNDGSCIRLRPGRKNHVWSYDFMAART